mmetsp:Transcript_10382/g.18946  ORF Transcript_10382/g.18946 Transcript_10382/m.18946 type:complete len:147 (-) Transcript_10382:283-723(-)
MIHFFLLQNRQGQTRIAKWYSPFEHAEKKKLQAEVYRTLIQRPSKHTNFVEFRNYSIIYRRYKGVFFIICCDPSDNEMAMLEAIHLFVECLDDYFVEVCELDLVFNFYKVFALLDEFILGGELQESSKRVILDRMALIGDFEKKSK